MKSRKIVLAVLMVLLVPMRALAQSAAQELDVNELQRHLQEMRSRETSAGRWNSEPTYPAERSNLATDQAGFAERVRRLH